MKSVESYITALLFDHDCVIVPNLGGFFTVRTEAGYEPEAHKFKAPGKRSAFNPALTHNDGLLIGSIAQESGISFEKAKTHVTQFTTNIHTALETGRGVSLSGLGTLTTNHNKKIIFTPDESINFDTSSHGLNSFHAVPVVKKEVREQSKVHVVNKEDHQESPVNIPPKSHAVQSGKRNWLAAAAILILLAGGSYLSWLIAFSGIMNPSSQFAAADLNPFAEKICDLYAPRKEIPLFLQSEWGSDQNPVQIKSGYAQLFLTDNLKTFIPVKTVDKPRSEAVNSQFTRGYYIVAGAFKSKSNAQKFVAQLQAKGYDGLIVDRKNSLYRVASNRVKSRQEAENKLGKIREQVNSGAWILTK